MKRLSFLIVLAGAAAFGLAAPAAALDDAAVLEVYKTKCFACHLADGNAPMKEMNLADAEWKHGTKLADIQKVIEEGVAGTAMLSFKAQLTPEEIEGLAKLVRSFDKTLKPEKPAKKK
jgi:mono/diheme cytochrome c family protein